MADTENASATRFLTSKLQPLANALLGNNAQITVGAAQWTALLELLTDEGVGDTDKILGHSATDGTGAPTVAQVKEMVVLLGEIYALVAAKVNVLSIIHTNLDLPQ